MGQIKLLFFWPTFFTPAAKLGWSTLTPFRIRYILFKKKSPKVDRFIFEKKIKFTFMLFDSRVEFLTNIFQETNLNNISASNIYLMTLPRKIKDRKYIKECFLCIQ